MKTMIIAITLVVSTSAFAETFVAKEMNLELNIIPSYSQEFNAYLLVDAETKDGSTITKTRGANCNVKADGLMICEKEKDLVVRTGQNLGYAPKTFEMDSPFSGILTFVNGEKLKVFKH